ncbi:MAG: nucleotidyltransferase domain-containing protein [Parvularculaceae bacterium]
MSKLLDLALETIRTRRQEFEERFGVRLIGVVGSVARGEERADSDVDIVYDISGRPTLFDLSEAAFELEDEFEREVDLVDPKSMRPNARAFIEKDLVVA